MWEVGSTTWTIGAAARGGPAEAAYASACDALLARYGVTARAFAVDADVPTFVLEHGTGTPVLFVHGTPATSAVFVPLLPELGNVRALLVDRPGHGLSAPFDYAGLPDLRTHAVEFLESVLDGLGLDRVVVAGSSLGGLWATWLALDRPDRVAGVVQLGAPPGMLGPRVPWLIGMMAVPWVVRLLRRLDPPSRGAARRTFRLMGDPPASVDATLADTFALAQRLPSVRGGAEHLVQRFVRFPGRFTDRNLWLEADDLARVTQPTLFVWGERDFVGGRDFARRVVTALPDARLVETGTGHLPWLQDPSGVANALTTFVRDLAA